MKRTAILLGVVQVIVVLGALPAGLLMIIDPSGAGVGMTQEMLSGSPFSDFLIPGIFLFAVNGLLNAIGAFLSFRRKRNAGVIGLGLGIILVLWICVQVYMIGLTHFLQHTFFVIGLIEIVLAYMYISKMKSTQVN